MSIAKLPKNEKEEAFVAQVQAMSIEEIKDELYDYYDCEGRGDEIEKVLERMTEEEIRVYYLETFGEPLVDDGNC